MKFDDCFDFTFDGGHCLRPSVCTRGILKVYIFEFFCIKVSGSGLEFWRQGKSEYVATNWLFAAPTRTDNSNLVDNTVRLENVKPKLFFRLKVHKCFQLNMISRERLTGIRVADKILAIKNTQT